MFVIVWCKLGALRESPHELRKEKGSLMKMKLFAVAVVAMSAHAAFADAPKVRCEKQLYAAALSEHVRIAAELKEGDKFVLKSIEGAEGTQRSFFVEIELYEANGTYGGN